MINYFRIIILNIIFLCLFNGYLSAEEKTNDWSKVKFSIGIGGGVSSASFLPTLADEIFLNYWPKPSWPISLNSGLLWRNVKTNFTPINLSLLTGYNKFWSTFRWYIHVGPDFVFDPFYYGIELNTGLEWLIFSPIAIGLKLTGKYLVDPSANGNAIGYATEGLGPFYYNDTHYEIKVLLTVSCVFN